MTTATTNQLTLTGPTTIDSVMVETPTESSTLDFTAGMPESDLVFATSGSVVDENEVVKVPEITSQFDGVFVNQSFVSDNHDVMYQNSDNLFVTEITDQQSGDVLDANLFSNAEYIIAKRKKVIVRKTLGDGITIENGVFFTKVDDGEITAREGTSYSHQFVVFDAEGNKRPPVFIRPLEIIRVVKELSE